MKRAALIFGVLFLVLTVMACDVAGFTIDMGSESEANGNDSIKQPPTDQPPTAQPPTAQPPTAQPPTVQPPTAQSQNAPVEAGIDAPYSGSNMLMGPVDIAYHASSLEGVSVVELSIDGAVVSSIASPDSSTKVVALRYTWNPPSVGNHILQVRAQNKAGAWSNLAFSAITIQSAQQAQVQQPQQGAPQNPQAPQTANTPEPTATPDKVTIYDVKFDKNKFYYGDAGCGSREITISAKVTRPDLVSGVYLFNRFYGNQCGCTSKWDTGHHMSKKSDGTYSITLASKNFANYNLYRYAVMNYQIVASGKTTDSTRLAFTEVFKDILLDRCP